MTDEISFSKVRNFVGQETYVEFLEWKLSHTLIEMDKIELEIGNFKKRNGNLERKAILIGSFFRPFFEPKRKLAKRKFINSHFTIRSGLFNNILWDELHINWFGSYTGTGIKI